MFKNQKGISLIVLVLIVVLVVVVGVVTIAFVINKDNDVSLDNNHISNPENEKPNNSTSKNYEISDDLEGTVEVNLTTTKYCFSSPGVVIKRANTGYIDSMKGYFVIYDQYVDLSSNNQYGIDYTTIKNTEDIMDVMKPQFIDTALNGFIYADDYDYVITSKENKIINGYNMTKFKGKFTLTCEWPLDYNQATFVGYSLLKNGYPIYFAVIDVPNGENRINIEEMADKIVKSFREYDGNGYDD